ncbi:MAG: hypothetical protein PSV23_03300 [Brevundimonas sp.]|uniref:hypothetical protein n=1 Tax=Brevundimonas sp. TaxID=1871086 RepID=UPI002489FCC0|nr:hypothetical protein [Brevundimonas sp.]MDI1325807.1 hypothetical protein [Brevundimonas sp.]
MRRVHSLPIALVAATMLAGAAVAQTPAPAARQDLRQLSWPGRSAAAPAPAASAAARTGLRRSNLVIPHGGFGAVQPPPAAVPAASTTPRRTLTPANAWLRPASPPPAPAPVRMEAPVPAPAASTAPRPAPTPEYLPDQGRGGQPVPADIAYAPASGPAPSDMPATPGEPADPMAPRRDAPIFRLQQAAPGPEPVAEAAAAPQGQAAAPAPRHVAQVSNTGERPPQQGARYYSVHRQNGRQPDALAMPEPTYVDALAITMTQTPASQDLAEPEQGPTLIRDSQGRTRPAPAASDGDHQ